MTNRIGSIFLVAGTAIGIGMLALPLTLARLGVVPSLLAMGVVCYVMYISALMGLELNLQAKSGLPLGELGQHFSGKGAQFIGNVSLMILMYSLLSAYTYAGSSLLKSLLSNTLGIEYGLSFYLLFYCSLAFVILSWKMKGIDSINRVLFIALLIVFIVLLGSFQSKISITQLPLVEKTTYQLSYWYSAVPILFTSFGFQIIFHTIYNYIGSYIRKLKSIFFFGSLLPMFVYMLWTVGVILVISSNAEPFYQKVIAGEGDVAELTTVLVQITEWPILKNLTWLLVNLAIATSLIGVGLGLRDVWLNILAKDATKSHRKTNFFAVFLTVVPAFIIAVGFSDVFMKALSFAGMILTVIAIYLPLFLLRKIDPKTYHYKILGSKLVQGFILLIASIVVCCELASLFS